MKIALLTPTFCEFSGIDRVVELEAETLAKEGHDVLILTLYGTIKTKYAKVVQLGAPKNSTLERIYRLFFFLDFPKIRKAAKLLKDYDVVISQLYPMNIIAEYAKKKYGVKYVARYHGYTPTSMFDKFVEKVYMFMLNILIFRTMKTADEIYSDSQFVADELYTRTGWKSIVKYIPINTKMYNLKAPILKKVALEFKSVKGPILLYVGRISPHKGLHLLIKSFNIIQKKYPQSKLVIIGKPTFKHYFDELKAMANEHVIFKGFVEDEYLPSYYRLCDIYVTCSLWEGYNMPAVEAQACGKPVVAFDIGAHKEVVKSGKGKLAHVNDVQQFSKYVLDILKRRSN